MCRPQHGPRRRGSWDTPPKAVDKAASTPQGCSLIPWKQQLREPGDRGVTQKVTDLGEDSGIQSPSGRTWADTAAASSTQWETRQSVGGAIVVIGCCVVCGSHPWRAGAVSSAVVCLRTRLEHGHNMIVHGDLSVTTLEMARCARDRSCNHGVSFRRSRITARWLRRVPRLGWLFSGWFGYCQPGVQNPADPWTGTTLVARCGRPYGAAALVGNGWGGFSRAWLCRSHNGRWQHVVLWSVGGGHG